MVLSAILYLIPPQPASAVSSARGSLGRLSRNGHGDEYDREVAYEEIKTILTQSLDEAGSKTFIKPNANSIASWRQKQVSYAFL
jgi:hypothetical protein